MRRLLVLGLVLVAALALAAVAFAATPPAISLTAAVAVYGACLATAAFVLNGRQAVVDRADLRAEITVARWAGPNGPEVVHVRLYNAGRRPVRVEEVGFWSDQSRPNHYPAWVSWEGSQKPVEIPKTFGETDSIRLWAMPGQVAAWYIEHHQPHWLCAKLARGDPLWQRLPPEADALIATAWPKAKERHIAELAAAEARGGVDGGGQPIGPKAME